MVKSQFGSPECQGWADKEEYTSQFMYCITYAVKSHQTPVCLGFFKKKIYLLKALHISIWICVSVEFGARQKLKSVS